MAAVTVHVLRSDGRPAGGAMVTVPRSTVPVPELALVADATGAATLDLPPGRFTIETFTKDGSRGRTEITVGGDAVFSVEIRIQAGGGGP
jgi:hypothetical protein